MSCDQKGFITQNRSTGDSYCWFLAPGNRILRLDLHWWMWLYGVEAETDRERFLLYISIFYCLYLATTERQRELAEGLTDGGINL